MAQKANKGKVEAFFSKYAEHQIVMVHDTKTIVNNQIMNSPHKVIQFHRGMYETSDPDIIEFLKNHNAYGMEFFSSEDARAAVSTQPEINRVTGDEVPEVARPKRTKAGEKATVAAKPTTSADVDADAGVEGENSEEDDD